MRRAMYRRHTGTRKNYPSASHSRSGHAIFVVFLAHTAHTHTRARTHSAQRCEGAARLFGANIFNKARAVAAVGGGCSLKCVRE